MADEAEGGEVAAKTTEPETAGDAEIEFIDWNYRLLSLKRVQADGENDEDEDYFTAVARQSGRLPRIASPETLPDADLVASPDCSLKGA